MEHVGGLLSGPSCTATSLPGAKFHFPLVLLGRADGRCFSFRFLTTPPFSCSLFLLHSQCPALGLSICVDVFTTITLCLGEHVECSRDTFTESWAIH